MNIEQLKAQDKKYAQVIADYLIKRCETDKTLEEKILATNKTLKGCVEYCKSEAKEQAEDGVAVIVDEEVFGWVVHYFLEDDLDFEKKEEPEKAPKKKTKQVTTLFGEETEEESKPEEKKKPKKEVKEKLAVQLSLFD